MEESQNNYLHSLEDGEELVDYSKNIVYPPLKKQSTSDEFIYRLYHKKQLGDIKKALGNKCTFIQHITGKKGSEKEYLIQINMRNTSGGVDRITYNLGTPFNNITPENYKDLLTMLQKGEYENGSEGTLQTTKRK